MTHWVHNLSPFAWQWGPDMGIRWYGLAYAVGLMAGWGLLIQLASKGLVPMDAKKRAEFIFFLVFGIIIGGRLGYMLLYDLPLFVSNPLHFFEFWRGGMASHGGFIGVAVACMIFAKKERLNFFNIGDAVCIMAPVGILLGRLANFVNGELWGKISNVPWAVIFPSSVAPGTPLELTAARHPSQLYEAALEGFFLLLYTQLRYRKTRLQPPGALTAEFLALYAVVRILGEQFREPDATLILGVSRGVFYSLLMLPIAGLLWWKAHHKTNAKV